MAILSVYIGRFQPLHKGHERVLQHALETSDAVLILIGSAHQARSIKNPFTFEERRDMLNAWVSSVKTETPVIIMPLRDQPYNDSKWIQSVQEKVDSVLTVLPKHGIQTQNQNVIKIVGSDRDTSTWYLNAFPQYKQDLIEPIKLDSTDEESLNATSLRNRFFASGVFDRHHWNDVPRVVCDYLETFARTKKEFKLLVDEYQFIRRYRESWNVAPYAPTFVTVDAVVVQSGHVLVIERGALPGKGLWALPGGFLDQQERLIDAAVRELIEETGIKVPAPVLKGSIKAKEIFDDPNRSLRGRTLTTAFLFRLDDTKPLPRVKGQNAPLHETGGGPVVETTKAFWLPISKARAQSERWFEDHHAILDTMIGMVRDK